MKSESKIQQECYQWFNNNYCLKNHSPRCYIFSVPNEGKSAQEQMYKKMLGMRSGVSDMIMLLPNKVLFIEFKDAKGRQSDNQKEFEEIVTNLGFEYHLIRSLETFQELFSLKCKL
jgi:hypothetical protein